ncbi:hypothetical protein ACFQ2B_20820 [Streptomyces stramineus]|uniref:Lipoprotein n=1 Tax=Streptomyces stramineus TaxID=173861 RepID=A0ABP3K990_9ACTN
MRHRALPTALLTLVALTGLTALAGCGTAVPDGAGPAAVPVGTPSPPGGTFLARGECAGREDGPFTEVDCLSERATARVLARYNGPRAQGPRCPAATDLVLHVAAVDQGTSEERSAPEGYACMRNLQPPHPGDPGMGGGPLTVPGDCVYTERDGLVKETACDGSGAHPPEYRVTAGAGARSECPRSTDLYVHVGGGAPVGCARRLR